MSDPRDSVRLLGVDEIGLKAESDGIWFYLTPCCSASVTGVSITPANPDGVACRACYRPVDPALAAAGWVEKEDRPERVNLPPARVKDP